MVCDESFAGGDVGPMGIDYGYWHECTMQDWQIVSWCMLLTSLCALFYLLGDTAEVYFAPTLVLLCDKLKVSPDVAGVTFLAFGNGAPDVFASIAAFSSGDAASGADIGLNALLGAGVFVTTAVVGAVVLIAEVSVHPRAFARDVGSYTLVLLVTVGFATMGSVNFFSASFFVFMYAIYVGVVMVMDKLGRVKKKKLGQPESMADGGGWWTAPSNAQVAKRTFIEMMKPNATMEMSEGLLHNDDDESGRSSPPPAPLDLSGLDDDADQGATFLTGGQNALGAALGAALGDKVNAEGGSSAGGGSGSGGGGSGGGGGGGAGGAVSGNNPFAASLAAALANEGGSGSGSGGGPIDQKKPVSSTNPFAASAAPEMSATSASDPTTDMPVGAMRPLGPTAGSDGGDGGGGGGGGKMMTGGFSAMIIDDYAPAPPPEDPAHAAPAMAVPDYASSDGSGGRLLEEGRSGRGRGLTNQRKSAGLQKSLYWNYVRFKRHAQQDIWRDFEEMAPLDQASTLLLLPFNVLRNASIPQCEESTWYLPYIVAMPIVAPQIALWAAEMQSQPSGFLGMSAWLASLLLGAAAAVGVKFTTHKHHPPATSFYFTTLLLVAFVMCVVWIFVFAAELVALLEALGKITHIPNGVMGLTVLAWGNSIGDMFSNISVAKTGRAEMAIAGCYGGPLFNLLVGLGISLVLQSMHSTTAQAGATASTLATGAAGGGLAAGTVPFTMDVYSKISMFFLLTTLVISAIVVAVNNYSFPKMYGVALIGWYVVYSAVNLMQMRYDIFGDGK